MLAEMTYSTDALLPTTVPQVPGKSQLGLGGSHKKKKTELVPVILQKDSRLPERLTL